MTPDAHLRAQRAVTLPDRYRIRRHIATGGMASVWCAEDLVLGRQVAVKVLAERFAHDSLAVERFRREARAAARVSAHPHVVTIYDVGELVAPEDAATDLTHATNRTFIVMEFLAGGTVADAIRHDTIRRHEALRWLREAASALDHAHRRGIVHRDIKPANFLLDRGRVLHVADFGIARLTAEETITSSDQLFGTAAYLSPEQALGREATGASDRYALAVAAFELLAGARPFSAEHFSAQARQHIEEPPPAASEIDRSLPPAVDDVLFAGLAKDPAARPETAGAFVAALEDALEGRPPARPPVRPRPIREPRPDPAVPVASTAAARRREPTRPPAPRTSAAPRGALHPRRVIAVGALAVAGLVIAAIALGAFGGGGRSRGGAVADRTTPTARHRTVTHAPARHVVRRTSSSSTATTRSVAATTSTAPPSPEYLQGEGHQEMLDGNYETAIPTLKQAVSTASPESLTYAYALYDLGRSELLSGDPQAAIPVLRQRLQIDNQRPVVQALLDQALAQAGAGSGSSTGGVAPTAGSTTPAPTPTTSTTTSPPAPPAAPVHGQGSGGAGLDGPGSQAVPPNGAVSAPGRRDPPPGQARRRGRAHRPHHHHHGFSPLQLLTAAAGG
jgi:eukaryotic-like serine/threonine-protein kinase